MVFTVNISFLLDVASLKVFSDYSRGKSVFLGGKNYQITVFGCFFDSSPVVFTKIISCSIAGITTFAYLWDINNSDKYTKL